MQPPVSIKFMPARDVFVSVDGQSVGTIRCTVEGYFLKYAFVAQSDYRKPMVALGKFEMKEIAQYMEKLPNTISGGDNW